MPRWIPSKWWKYALASCSVLTEVSVAIGGGFIDTPDTCYLPERIESGVVYLKPFGKCAGKPGRAFIDTELKSIKVSIEGSNLKEVAVQPLAIEDVSSVLDKAKVEEGKLKIPQNLWKDEMDQKAAETNELYVGKEYQAKLKAETERLRKDVLDNSFASFYPDIKKEKEEGKNGPFRLPSDERIYIFISSSMPMRTIRNYADSVAELGDPNIIIVMRGFIGGVTKINPTIRFITAAIKTNPACDETNEKCDVKRVSISVDPLLFRKYEIDRVPAVVYAQGVSLLDSKMSEGKLDNVTVKNFYSLFGDASLEYILIKLGQESRSSSLAKLLASL